LTTNRRTPAASQAADHALAVFPARGHRLFGDHVAARLARDLDGLLRMQAGGRGDDDGVGIARASISSRLA
jgi:hypothetical protein